MFKLQGHLVDHIDGARTEENEKTRSANASLGHGICICTHYVHVCLAQLRPFRMTLLELAQAKTTENELWLAQKLVSLRPCLHTTYEFVTEMLRVDLAWDISCYCLSDKMHAIPRVAGWVRVLPFDALPPERMWAGEQEMLKNNQRRARRAHNVLDAAPSGSTSRETQPVREPDFVDEVLGATEIDEEEGGRC